MILMVGIRGNIKLLFNGVLEHELGHEVASARTGKDLRQMLTSHSVELVLLNLDLADEKGPYLLKKLRKTHTLLDLPIICVVRGQPSKRIAAALDMGANDCIAIPANPLVVKSRVRNLLAMRKLYLKGPSDALDTQPIEEPAVLPTPSTHAYDTQSSDDVTRTIGQLYSKESDEGLTIPCEFPLLLIMNSRNYFSKSIWVGRQSLLALAFEILPKEPEYQIQIVAPSGEPMRMDVRETSREKADSRDAGMFKIHLEIINAPHEYDTFHGQLHTAWQRHGLNGLEAIWRGEAFTDRGDGDATLEGTFKSNVSIFSVTGGIRYRFQRFLGKGGFASVFLVEDLTLKRSVAMKVLNRKFAQIPEARNNFLSEAQIAAQFHHPNIVFVYEVGEISESKYSRYLDFPTDILDSHPERLIYFTMQFVEGETLTRWNRQHDANDQKTRLKIFMEICRALSYAHSKGVVHRDIKPDNIMIARDGHVLVADFGIASVESHDDSDSNLPDSPSGDNQAPSFTPQYASPEQITGATPDHRSDLYSLGILIYEAMTGKLPFGSLSIAGLISSHLTGTPQPPREIRQEIPPELERLILRLLEKKPEHRFQNADEVFQVLLEIKGTGSMRSVSKEELLAGLLREARTVEEVDASAENLKAIIAYLHSHKTYDDVAYIREIKERLTQKEVLECLLEHNLNEQNKRYLFDFFKELASSRMVMGLLEHFNKASEPWKKLALAQFAILSSGRNLFPLVIFGLDLVDAEAYILLEAFSDLAYQNLEPIFLKWAEHPGEMTQAKLLSMLYALNRSEAETLEILKWFSSGKGTTHRDVRDRAARMLAEY